MAGWYFLNGKEVTEEEFDQNLSKEIEEALIKTWNNKKVQKARKKWLKTRERNQQTIGENQ